MISTRWLIIPVALALVALAYLVAGENGDTKLREPLEQIEEAAPSLKESAGGIEATGASKPEPSCEGRTVIRQARSGKEMKALRGEAARLLAASGDHEMLLASAMLMRSDDFEVAARVLHDLGGFAATNPLVVWTLLSLCAQRTELECDYRPFERFGIITHGANGAMWLVLAIRYLGQDKDDEALAALQAAAASPEFDTYYGEQVSLVARSLSASTDLLPMEHFEIAVGLASVVPESYAGLEQRCREEESLSWLDACESIGRRMSEGPGDILTRMIGLGIREAVAKRLEDESRLAEISRKQNEIREPLGSLEQVSDSLNLVMNDESELQEFLHNLETFGEFEAFRLVAAEVGRLRALPGYDPCNFESPILREN